MVMEPSAFVTLVVLTIVVDEALLDDAVDELPPPLPDPDLEEPAVLPVEPAAADCPVCAEAPAALPLAASL